MTPLNYHHLYYFKTIATEGSISKAANKLLLGQPTLSMQLKQFEESIGHRLFERKNRSLILTEMGRLILNYANEIFKLGDEMLDAVSDRPSLKKFKIQIGALDSIPKVIIRQLMGVAFSMQECAISILEGEGPDLIDDLMNHRLDLVISNLPGTMITNEKLYSKSITKMPLVMVGSEKFKDLNENYPKSLEGVPFIFPTYHSRVRTEIEQYFSTIKIKPNIIAETQDTSLMKSLAVEGHGLVIIAETAVRGALRDGLLYKIHNLEGFHEELWLIAGQRKIQNPIAEKLVKEFTFDLSRAPVEKVLPKKI